MKEIKIEKTVYGYQYEAADGTVFDDRDACIKYDKSVACVMKSRIKEMSINSGAEEDLLFAGSCDNEAFVCIPKDKNDINTIKQSIAAFGGGQDYVDRFDDSYIGSVVLVIFGYDGDGCWVTSYNKIVEEATEGAYTVVKKED